MKVRELANALIVTNENRTRYNLSDLIRYNNELELLDLRAFEVGTQEAANMMAIIFHAAHLTNSNEFRDLRNMEVGYYIYKPNEYSWMKVDYPTYRDYIEAL